MVTDKNLSFISQKIEETKVAILCCYTSGLLKIPNHIIQTLHIDKDGYIWFLVDRPRQLISQFDPEFPVTLNYFKKGQGYTMNISGHGQLVTNLDEISDLSFLTEADRLASMVSNVLMKVKMLKVNFNCYQGVQYNSIWKKIKSAFLRLAEFSESRTYDFTA